MADWYGSGPYATYVDQRRTVNTDVPISMMRISQPAGDFSDPPGTDLSFFMITGTPCTGEFDMGNGSRRVTLRAGDMGLQPMDFANKIQFETPQRFLVMYFSGHLARPLIERAGVRGWSAFDEL